MTTPKFVFTEFCLMKLIKLFNFKSQLSISDPEPITRINATEITDSAVTLMWDSPRGEYNAFEVQYLNTEGMFLMYILFSSSN